VRDCGAQKAGERVNTQVMKAPCTCGECVQAGVSELPQVVNVKTGEALHGYALKRWHEARENFLEAARKAAGVPSEASEPPQ
jgi:hypothetical protein